MTVRSFYRNVADLDLAVTNTMDISVHDGLTKGLMLGSELVTATAKEINRACDVSGRLVNLTASTLTVSAAVHDGRIITVNKADGTAITLPAATGSGLSVRFFIGTTITSNSTTIKVANSSDTMVGFMVIFQDGGDTSLNIEVGGTNDTITLNGTTKGGIQGDMIELIDIATNLWYVSGKVSATGTGVSNLSATV